MKEGLRLDYKFNMGGVRMGLNSETAWRIAKPGLPFEVREEDTGQRKLDVCLKLR